MIFHETAGRGYTMHCHVKGDFFEVFLTTVKEAGGLLVQAKIPIVKATVDANRFTFEWMSQDWSEWKELVDSAEFKKLVEKAVKAVNKATEAKGKAVGKGKSGF